jgi:hypothetical protein
MRDKLTYRLQIGPEHQQPNALFTGTELALLAASPVVAATSCGK